MTANTLTSISTTPNTANDPTDLYPTLWYPLHEGTGLTLSEAFGNGYALDVTGTTTNLWSATGYATPNSTDIKAVKSASATGAQTTYVDAIFNMQTLKNNLGSTLYIGYEVGIPAANSSQGTLAIWGRNNSTYGGVWFDVNGSDQPIIALRGDDAGSSTSVSVGRTFGDTFTGTKACVGAFYFSGANTLIATFYIEGLTAGSSSLDLTGLTMPTGSTEGLALFARRTSGTSFANWFGGGSSFLNNIWFQRRTSFDENLGPAALADMISNKMSFPNSMRT